MLGWCPAAPAGRHISSLSQVLARPGTVPQEIQPSYCSGVTVLLRLDVSPDHAQVALVDATWQDYPQWETGCGGVKSVGVVFRG